MDVLKEIRIAARDKSRHRFSISDGSSDIMETDGMKEAA
jgi:hypothetical protein